MINENKNSFEGMIPLYLNGQLTPEQKKSFERAIEKNTRLKTDFKEYSMIKQSYSDLSEDLPPLSPDIYPRIMEKIKAESEKTKKQKSLIARLTEYIKNGLSARWLAWSVAAVQMAVILFFVLSPAPETQFRTLSVNHPQSEPGIQVNVIFHDNAEEKKIRTLLANLNASIINGPQENGLYIVLIKESAKMEEALNILKTASIVKFVQSRY